jgi:hypothetical protein
MLFKIDFEVDDGASYTKDSTIVIADSAAVADEKLRHMIGSIDSETCVSRIFSTSVFNGTIFTGKHGWR